MRPCDCNILHSPVFCKSHPTRVGWDVCHEPEASELGVRASFVIVLMCWAKLTYGTAKAGRGALRVRYELSGKGRGTSPSSLDQESSPVIQMLQVYIRNFNCTLHVMRIWVYYKMMAWWNMSLPGNSTKRFLYLAILAKIARFYLEKHTDLSNSKQDSRFPYTVCTQSSSAEEQTGFPTFSSSTAPRGLICWDKYSTE